MVDMANQPRALSPRAGTQPEKPSRYSPLVLRADPQGKSLSFPAVGTSTLVRLRVLTFEKQDESVHTLVNALAASAMVTTQNYFFSFN